MLIGLIFVEFAYIFSARKHLKIGMNMKAANIFSAQGDDVINMMNNAGFFGKAISFFIKLLNLDSVKPRRSCSFYNPLSQASAHGDFCFIFSIVFLIALPLFFWIVMTNLPSLFSKNFSIFSPIFGQSFFNSILIFSPISGDSFFVIFGSLCGLIFTCSAIAMAIAHSYVTPLAGSSPKHRLTDSSAFSFSFLKNNIINHFDKITDKYKNINRSFP